MRLETTLIYWLSLSLVLAQEKPPPSSSLLLSDTLSHASATHIPNNRTTRSIPLITGSKPASRQPESTLLSSTVSESASRQPESTLSRSTIPGSASSTISPGPSSQAPITPPPSRSLTTSLAPPPALTTSVSDGKTIAIAVGAAVGAVVVVGGAGGGFVAFGSSAPIAVAAGQVLRLQPDNDSGGSNNSDDEPEIQTLTSISLSLTESEQATTTTSSVTSSSTTFKVSSTTSSSSSAQPSQTQVAQNYVVTIMLAVAEDPTQKADFETFLAPFAQPGTMKDLSKEFDSPEDLGIYVLLTTEDNAAIIRKDPRVLSIDLDVDSGFDEPSTAAPDQSEQITLDTFDGFVIQTPSQDALGDLSLPLPVNVQGFTPSNVPGYAYQQEAGKGVTVYVLDTGANPAHDDFAKAEGNKRWLFASEDTAEDDKNGHGSCVQSLVNGPLFGVAKAADIVIVKLGARFTLDNILFGLLLVYQDVIKNKLQGKAVVNMSLGSQLLVPSTNNQGKNPGFILPQAIAGYNSTIQLLIDEDVVVVAASGNSRDEPGGSEFVTAFPAFLGRQLNMIAVGAVTAEGKREDYSQGVPRELDTSAVGTTVCASNLGNADVEKTGTSMSAPLVSGMIAVWLSSAQYRARLQVPGQVAANVKQLVRELSYNRFGGGDTPVAWNGVDVFTCNSGISGSAKLRARAGQCVINSTSTALPTASPPPQPPSATVPVVVSTMTPPPPAQTPLPCYNFNVDAYGYCCATADSPCGDGVGTCWLPFTGVGVGGGGDGINLLPTGARCPPPPGAKDDF